MKNKERNMRYSSRIVSPLVFTTLLFIGTPLLADAGGLRGLKKNDSKNNGNNAAGSTYTSYWASGNTPSGPGQNQPDLSQGSVSVITVNGGDRTITNNVPASAASSSAAATNTIPVVAASTNPQPAAVTTTSQEQTPAAPTTVIPPAIPASGSNANGGAVAGLTVTRPDGTIAHSVGSSPAVDRTEDTPTTATSFVRPIATTSSNNNNGKGKGKGNNNKSRQIDFDANEAITSGANWLTGSVGDAAGAAPDLTQGSVGPITVTKNP